LRKLAYSDFCRAAQATFLASSVAGFGPFGVSGAGAGVSFLASLVGFGPVSEPVVGASVVAVSEISAASPFGSEDLLRAVNALSTILST